MSKKKNYCERCNTCTGDVVIVRVFDKGVAIYTGKGICGVCSKILWETRQ